ncbi:MAG: hypothetical protein P8045_13935 [Candidatus Thiodiazotropha sp.]
MARLFAAGFLTLFFADDGFAVSFFLLPVLGAGCLITGFFFTAFFAAGFFATRFFDTEAFALALVDGLARAFLATCFLTAFLAEAR